MTDLDNDFREACEDLVRSYTVPARVEDLFDALVTLALAHGKQYVPQVFPASRYTGTHVLMLSLTGTGSFGLDLDALLGPTPPSVGCPKTRAG